MMDPRLHGGARILHFDSFLDGTFVDRVLTAEVRNSPLDFVHEPPVDE